MKKYKLCITPAEYSNFKTHPSTRLYLHSYDGNELTVDTSNPKQLAKDLEKVIDFGATSAVEVLGLPAHWVWEK